MQDAFQYAATALEFPDAAVYGLAQASWSVFSPLYTPFETTVMSMVPDQVNAVRSFFDANRVETKRPLPLSDPLLGLFCVLCYPISLILLYVFSKIVGKFTCRMLGLMHNFFLFSLSLYMGVGILVTAVASFDGVWNQPVKAETENDWRMTKFLWLFCISKLFEYVDTYIMILKQNFHQVTFLHLYHHTSTFAICFILCIVAPGGDTYFSEMLNSFIHVIMYGYYFFTMLYATGRIRNFFNSIKFMITKGQMAQFFTNLIHSVYIAFIVKEPRYSVVLMKILVVYMISLLALFGNFLFKGQAKAKSKDKHSKKVHDAKKQQ